MNPYNQNMMHYQMNPMNQMNQMNQLIHNNINQNQVQNEPIEIEANFCLLYGIKDPIKKIKFKNISNNNIYNATISKYFTSELYSFIGVYDKNHILIYNNDTMEDNESNINDIYT